MYSLATNQLYSDFYYDVLMTPSDKKPRSLWPTILFFSPVWAHPLACKPQSGAAGYDIIYRSVIAAKSGRPSSYTLQRIPVSAPPTPIRYHRWHCGVSRFTLSALSRNLQVQTALLRRHFFPEMPLPVSLLIRLKVEIPYFPPPLPEGLKLQKLHLAADRRSKENCTMTVNLTYIDLF